MNKAFERPFRPIELTASTIKSFPLQAMAQQLMTEETFTQSGRDGLTLARDEDLTVVLTVAKEGEFIKEHQAPGPVTIILLSGSMVLSTEESGEKIPLESGSAVILAANMAHSVEVKKDSAFLIVIGGKM